MGFWMPGLVGLDRRESALPARTAAKTSIVVNGQQRRTRPVRRRFAICLGAMTPETPDSASNSSGDSRDSAPSRAEIEELAYRIWEQEGRKEGHANEHWRQAESLLQAQRLSAA